VSAWWRGSSARVRLAVVLLIAVGLGWPATAVAEALGEPIFEQTMLALSWIAPALTACDILFTAQVKQDQDRQNDDSSEGTDEGGV
jgi:hypothetical protein